ncbi:DNA polymerase/3'-5' exonuclease PolX [Thiohalorhabdus sp.]|uniref:DNA polymerase/3'-5' exonuclease PolX n=1 Tax=Thiohalorhabdus sp. TaxID=3094134 RepID=UPI002FC3141F
MAVRNQEIADLFNRLADLLEVEDANPFRVRAYRNAARVIGSLSPSLSDLVADGEDLTHYPGIGDDLADKIRTIVTTGELPDLREVEHRVPAELSDLMHIKGLGPKRVKALYQELGIDSLDQLEAAARQGRIRQLEGFGAKTEQSLLEGIEYLRGGGERRTLLGEAEEVAERLKAHLEGVEGAKLLEVAGSYRRRKETVGDLDILVACADAKPIMDAFVGYDEVAEVASRGETRSTVYLRSGLQVDLRVVPRESYGAALHYFTGSQAHNVAVRQRGVSRGYKINEYGVFQGESRLAGTTEAEVYATVGLDWIPPELRENRGEIEAAVAGELPCLVEQSDLRGDLHCHTRATDGGQSPREMAEAARERGYDYLAITDHSRRVAMAHGLDADRLRAQMAEIDRLNDELSDITLLKGCEVDILEDGSLDLPDDALSELDLAVCSVHYQLDLPRSQQTERILKAMDNPYCSLLGHATGRQINEREPMDVDMERIIAGATERGVVLEVNAQPARLDLRDEHCRMARDYGARLAIATDAHNADNLGLIRFGVGQARRGWLRAEDVINTWDLAGLRRALER